jgi:hypothetical protein
MTRPEPLRLSVGASRQARRPRPGVESPDRDLDRSTSLKGETIMCSTLRLCAILRLRTNLRILPTSTHEATS